MAYVAISYVATALFCAVNVVETQHSYGYYPYAADYTRTVALKQGNLQGIVVRKWIEGMEIVVEQYLGIPYAKPPVGRMRFMPPVSALPWTGTKIADVFRDVCPQIRPSTANMEAGRRSHVRKLLEILKNESEDCLYLNIYAPHQDERLSHRYPVMVYIHGESFEWNSGNAYDGSVLADYGKVIVVTLNFRLGVLGFLKVSPTISNLGLIDQIAALLWIKQNIASFGGDPNKVTLFGHSTGAACISHLMLSPMINYHNYGTNEVHNNYTVQKLFQRAILMSGNALSDWALATNPSEVTRTLAGQINCTPIPDQDFSACFGKHRLYDILDAVPPKSQYVTRFGPVVDGMVIPDKPEKVMNTDIFSSFEVMYGVTELESVHLLGDVALTHGMLEREFESELDHYMGTRCEFKSRNVCVERTNEEYGTRIRYRESPLHISPFDEAGQARDVLLELLSDARTAAPVVMMGKLHSIRNASSYFYVFGHSTASRALNLRGNKTVHGEDLPFVFGVPLDPVAGQRYTKEEMNLTKMMMSLWSNFAYTGNPNNHDYMRKVDLIWYKYGIKWPEYDSNEQFLYIKIPPTVKSKYREGRVKYWNEHFPQLREIPRDNPPKHIDRSPRPQIDRSSTVTTRRTTYSTVPIHRQIHVKQENSKTQHQKPNISTGTATNVIIILGVVFLLINVTLFTLLYYKCVILKRKNSPPKTSIEDPPTAIENNIVTTNKAEANKNGCNIMKMMGTKSSKSGDTYEAVKTHKTGSSKKKLTRQLSSSTLDAHTKVREWISQELVNKYSPKAIRKNRRQISLDSKNSKKKDRKSDDFKDIVDGSGLAASSSTLGQSPTRPVSPVEEIKDSPKLATLKKKADKVSVAVDATPTGRGSSVLRQEPIELMKSLDYGSFDSGDRELPLRRSATLDDVWSMKHQEKLSKRNSTSINLQLQQPSDDECTVIKIEHHHSKSEPVDANAPRKLKTFDPGIVNVTSRDEPEHVSPLTPEESLQVIKRRCPKVLPDLPGYSKNNVSHKRRSMPAPSYLFLPIPENSSFSQPSSPCGTCAKPTPPPPPPRISTLGRAPQSCPMLAEEPPLPEEPEIACNNLYIGPLIPSRENRKVIMKPPDAFTLENQPIYDNITPKQFPKTIITADNAAPIKKIEPKVIIKPIISRTISDPSKCKGPRVVVNDNLAHLMKHDTNKTEKSEEHGTSILTRQHSKRSPSPVKDNQNSEQKGSSTDSTPSEESDTGTVVKKV